MKYLVFKKKDIQDFVKFFKNNFKYIFILYIILIVKINLYTYVNEIMYSKNKNKKFYV